VRYVFHTISLWLASQLSAIDIASWYLPCSVILPAAA